MTLNEAINQLNWYFYEDDGLASEKVTKDAYEFLKLCITKQRLGRACPMYKDGFCTPTNVACVMVKDDICAGLKQAFICGQVFERGCAK